MITLWNEAIVDFKFPRKDHDTYREGFRSGWLDRCLGHDSVIARTSTWGHYAMGYIDGYTAYSSYNLVKQEGEVTCLKNLFQ